MRKLNKVLFIFIIAFSLNALSQNAEGNRIKKSGFIKEIIKNEKDTIFYIRNVRNNQKPKPTIIFLQGSLPIPLFYEFDKKIKVNLPFNTDDYNEKYNFIVISRKGVPLILNYEKHKNGYYDKNGKSFLSYEKFNNLDYRKEQAQLVLEDLLNKEWVDKESIYVLGHSEGYRVAARLAENNTKVAKLVCMSADPFNRIAEEMIKERVACLASDNDSLKNENISLLIEDYKNIDEDIEKFRSDIELYNWMSYNKVLSFESLQKYERPILVVYGTEDISAAHNDLLPFLLKKSQLTLKSYPDYNHNFFKKEYDSNKNKIEDSYHWDEVFRDVVNWLEQKK